MFLDFLGYFFGFFSPKIWIFDLNQDDAGKISASNVGWRFMVYAFQDLASHYSRAPLHSSSVAAGGDETANEKNHAAWRMESFLCM